MSNNKKIIILNFQKESDQSATLRALEKMYERHANVDVQVVANGTEAAQLAKMYQGGLFLFSVFDKRDVAQLLTFITGAGQELQDGTIKMAGYNNLNNKKLEKYLSQNGCAEEFYGRLTPKTLGYKITLWFKAIDFAASKVEERKKKEEENKATEIRFGESMKLASDCWILNNKEDIHNSLRQWFLDIVGPSPCAGKWVEIENKKDHYDKYWEWKPKLEQEFPFITDLGQWIFKGMEPKFSWKSNSWQFTGKDIYLGFYHQDSDRIDYRFVANQTGANIAENSSAALSKRTMIIESCDPKYHVDNEDLYQKKDAHFEKEAIANNLEGEVATPNEAIDGHLKGRNQSDQVTSGHYRGQVQNAQNRSKDLEKDLDFDPLQLQKELKELSPDAADNKLNQLDNRLKGKIGAGLNLDLESPEQSDNESGPTSRAAPHSPFATKSKLALDLEKSKELPENDLSDEMEKAKKEMANSLSLDLLKNQDRLAKEREATEQKRKEAERNAPKKLDLEKEREELERQLEDEKKKLNKKSILDLGLPKTNNTEANEGQVDHLQKYYGFVHEMGLTPELTADEELQDPLEDSASEKSSNGRSSALKALAATNAERVAKERAGNPTGNKKSAHEQPSDEDQELLDRETPAARRRHLNENPHGQSSKEHQGLGIKEQAPEDLAGEGSRADYIEKYYGTTRKPIEEQERNGLPPKNREKEALAAKAPSLPQGKGPLKTPSEIDLFGGDRANLQDIKLLTKIIRKGKSSGIFDEATTVDLSDLFDNFMVLSEKSQTTFDAGERVLIKVDCSYLGRNNLFDFFGTIAEIEEIEDPETNSKNLSIELTKFEKKHLDEISRIFLERQSNIMKFFKAAKGLE